MTRTAVLKGFLGRIGFSVAAKPDTWGVINIEKMLHELGINGYEFMYQSKVVKLRDKDQLMRVLKHSVPSEVSSEYNLIGHSNEDLKLQLRGWQFEAKA